MPLTRTLHVSESVPQNSNTGKVKSCLCKTFSLHLEYGVQKGDSTLEVTHLGSKGLNWCKWRIEHLPWKWGYLWQIGQLKCYAKNKNLTLFLSLLQTKLSRMELLMSESIILIVFAHWHWMLFASWLQIFTPLSNAT